MQKRKTRKQKPEQLLSLRVANFMRTDYPDVIFRFDLAADMPLPIYHAKRNRELHGKWSRGYPDLLIAKMRGKYGGLYLELKATPKVPNTPHTVRQRAYHELLKGSGYKVKFTCGFDEAIRAIKKYLK